MIATKQNVFEEVSALEAGQLLNKNIHVIVGYFDGFKLICDTIKGEEIIHRNEGSERIERLFPHMRFYIKKEEDI